MPIPFTQLIDPATGRARVRMVDVHSERYAIARRYMIRVRRDDFDDSAGLARIAAAGAMSVDEFRRQFEYLVAEEPPGLELGEASVTGRAPARPARLIGRGDIVALGARASQGARRRPPVGLTRRRLGRLGGAVRG